MNNIADIGSDFFGNNNPLRQAGGVSIFAGSIVSNLILLAGVVLIFTIVIAGFTMVTGAGDPQHFEKAKITLTSGVVGFVIVVAAWFVTRIIESSTGVNILQP